MVVVGGTTGQLWSLVCQYYPNQHKCVGSMLTVSESDIITNQQAQQVNCMKAQRLNKELKEDMINSLLLSQKLNVTVY